MSKALKEPVSDLDQWPIPADLYLQIVEAGLLEDAHVELLGGKLVFKAPPGPDDEQWPISADLYLQIVEAGFLEDVPVELLHGKLVAMTPQSNKHWFHTDRIRRLLESPYSTRFHVRADAPLRVSADSVPEPDVFIVRGGVETWDEDTSPTALDCVLVVEIAISSQRNDRGPKRDQYANAGIPEYWVIDPIARTIDIYQNPADGAYQSHTVASPTDTVQLPETNTTISASTLLGIKQTRAPSP